MTVWEQAPEGADAIGTQKKFIAFTKDNHKSYWNPQSRQWQYSALPFETLMVKPKVNPKWTHTDAMGVPCKLLVEKPDSEGYVIIEREDGIYANAKPDKLKKRQPQISKEAADAIQNFVAYASTQSVPLPFSFWTYLEMHGIKDASDAD